jgi:hypothetical protein
MSSDGNTTEVGRLLAELCAKLGFCLPPEEQARLEDSPPPGVDALTDAVLLAEGFDPQLVDEELRQQVRDLVAKYLEEGNAAAGSGESAA